MKTVRLGMQSVLAGAVMLALGGAVVAARTADKAAAGETVARGKIKFERVCAPCHGQGAGHDGAAQLPGTAALSRKYEDERPGALELRTDLTPDVLGFFVRNGSGPMPGFRKTEVSDADIDAIAAYLKSTASKAGK